MKSKGNFCNDNKKSLAESDKGSWHNQPKEEMNEAQAEPVPNTSENFSDSDDSRSSSEENNASFFGFSIFCPLFFFFSFPHLYGALNFKKENVTVKFP